MLSPRDLLNKEVYRRQTNVTYRSTAQRLHIDMPLLIALMALIGFGLAILYSAVNQEWSVMLRQATRLGLAGFVMFTLAQISPDQYKRWTPWLFTAGTLLLIAVLIMGHIGKGAQRWLDLGFIRFQPSELMKLVVPMMAARYLSDHPLPPRLKDLLITGAVTFIPALIIAKQPDLGTALMIVMSGACVLLFAGMSWRIIALCGTLGCITAPVLWHFMHAYQRRRILTFLNPERDPLGSGYHII